MNNIKKFWNDLLNNRPVLIVLIIIIAAALYSIWKNNNMGMGNNIPVPNQSPQLVNLNVTPPSGSNFPTTPPTGSPVVQFPNNNQHQLNPPGSTFKGPTGVNHYVTTGNETLSQIAKKLSLQGWNSIYAIPENQNNGWLPKNLSPSMASSYTPPAGVPLVY